MSDIHHLPLVGHDPICLAPFVRARVYGRPSATSGQTNWYWHYTRKGSEPPLIHGPFESWGEAYGSAHRMVELL